MRTHLLILEGFHEIFYHADCQWEGEPWARIDLRDVNVFVGEISLPLRVPTHLVLSEDMGDQVPCNR